MNDNSAIYKPLSEASASIGYTGLLRPFLAGLLIPFGFAPFHLPGFSILGVAFLYALLNQQSVKQSFLTGFSFGLGFLSLGVSWVYVSIHEYGHLNALFSGLITLLFIFYLSLYPALVAVLYTRLAAKCTALFSCILFSAIWCLGEYLRSTVMSGFPWLLLGFGQIDTPLRYLLPVVGVYGVSFLTCLAATFLVKTIRSSSKRRYIWLVAFVALLTIPSFLKHKKWASALNEPISVGIIQANLSMRDKWDESLFWQLVEQYRESLEQLMGKKQLIVMPESAIPLPQSYISDFIDSIDLQAKQSKSSILLGIPTPTNDDYYYNTLMSLGDAQGTYVKQHLVPFGEYIPKPFEQIVKWLAIPTANLKPGKRNQMLIQVNNHPIATLICYELAYPNLLRKQLPKAEWIVSISDDGWFGRSLAMYQQLQMSQVLSLQVGRFQVVSNNDGLSSIIDLDGNIVASLPAISAGILEENIYPATGTSPWVYFGDLPVLIICLLIILWVPLSQLLRKRNYKI